MAEIELKAGARLDLLSPREFRDGLGAVLPGGWEGEQRARGWGVKPLQYKASANAAITTTTGFIIPPTPNVGYVWALRSLALNFSASQAARLWFGDTSSTGPGFYPLGLFGASAIPSGTFSSTQVLLRAGENIVVTSGAAVTLGGWCLSVLETPEELVWKLT